MFATGGRGTGNYIPARDKYQLHSSVKPRLAGRGNNALFRFSHPSFPNYTVRIGQPARHQLIWGSHTLGPMLKLNLQFFNRGIWSFLSHMDRAAFQANELACVIARSRVPAVRANEPAPVEGRWLEVSWLWGSRERGNRFTAMRAMVVARLNLKAASQAEPRRRRRWPLAMILRWRGGVIWISRRLVITLRGVSWRGSSMILVWGVRGHGRREKARSQFLHEVSGIPEKEVTAGHYPDNDRD